MPLVASSYRAPRWLPGGHLQTIYPATCMRKPAVTYRRERWRTDDGDFIDIDFMDGQPGQPLLVLFHGLEGSSHSHYARALMAHIAALGWSGAVPHFRGCSGEPNHALQSHRILEVADATRCAGQRCFYCFAQRLGDGRRQSMVGAKVEFL